MTKSASKRSVSAALYWKTRVAMAAPQLFRALGRLESWALREETEGVELEAPIYVTSLARAGTTILTELLNAHPDVTSHRYADFPFVDVPFWRNWVADRSRVAKPVPQERAHRDRIMVTVDSPEAVEEWLWRAHFPGRHDPAVDQRLTAADRNASFDSAYTDHLRKLLLVRGASRYLAKGNYNIARISYLADLFPGARFVVPVREPVAHIASLDKQHRLFLAHAEQDPRTRYQLGASGHFEFGADRVPTHFGDPKTTESIVQAWAIGNDAEGWARLWNETYRYLLDLLDQDAQLRAAVLLVPYDGLCSSSEFWIDKILSHCRLESGRFEAEKARFATLLSPPSYYQPRFGEEVEERIRALTASTRARLPFYL